MENKNSTKHPSAYKIISIVVIVILAILFTFPLYWIITGSFKTGELSEVIQPSDRTAVPV